MHFRPSTTPSDVLQRLDARLVPLEDLEPGQRFLIPGTCRTGRVLPGSDHLDQVRVELSAHEGTTPEHRWLRPALLVQLVPDPPAEPALR